MSYENSEAWEKFDALNRAVMDGSPSEAADMAKKLGEVRFTAQALGLACRYRGLDMVRALVEGGARFTCDDNIGHVEYKSGNFAAALLSQIYLSEMSVVYNIGEHYDRPMLPIKDRLGILDYLCETAGKTGFDEGELLFYSYFSGDKEITDHLKKNGTAISEEWVRIITEGGGKDERTKEKWFDYCSLTEQLSDENYLPCMSAVVSEIGERKLYFTDWLWHISINRLGLPGFMKFLLLNFDHSKIKKGMLMKEIILRDDVESLELAAENGWLKMPKKRDEMIAFAADNKKTECTAWLLDFKNRTADLAKERERAEKKQERELNADPNSAAEMKKIWNFEKRENGGVIITGYKGDKTDVVVPEKIGKNTVTAIGEYAFSPDAKRLRAEQRKARRAIVRINLPDTVTEIGKFAFSSCFSLNYIKFPKGAIEISEGMMAYLQISTIEVGGNVKKIGASAFCACLQLRTVVLCEGVEEIDNMAFYCCGNLATVEIPRSVKSIALGEHDTPFTGCPKLTVAVHKGSYAEQYCKEHGIKFKNI